jgi:type IV pilus assembly protein PilA
MKINARHIKQGFTLIELMIVVAIIGILAAIAIPQYQTYIGKTQVSRVMGEEGAVKAAIEICLSNGQMELGVLAHQCHPLAKASNLVVGDSPVGEIPPAGQGYPTVILDKDKTTITAIFGNSAMPAVKDKYLRFTRDIAGTWKCTSNTVAPFRPRGCELEN